MKLTIEIDMGNDAFSLADRPYLASTEALRIIGTKIHDVIQEASTEAGIDSDWTAIGFDKDCYATKALLDLNGNTVGRIEVSPDTN